MINYVKNKNKLVNFDRIKIKLTNFKKYKNYTIIKCSTRSKIKDEIKQCSQSIGAQLRVKAKQSKWMGPGQRKEKFWQKKSTQQQKSRSPIKKKLVNQIRDSECKKKKKIAVILTTKVCIKCTQDKKSCWIKRQKWGNVWYTRFIFHLYCSLNKQWGIGRRDGARSITLKEN